MAIFPWNFEHTCASHWEVIWQFYIFEHLNWLWECDFLLEIYEFARRGTDLAEIHVHNLKKVDIVLSDGSPIFIVVQPCIPPLISLSSSPNRFHPRAKGSRPCLTFKAIGKMIHNVWMEFLLAKSEPFQVFFREERVPDVEIREASLWNTFIRDHAP